MWRAFRSLVGAVVIAGASAPAVAQVNVQPTPAPVVTADDRPWFRARDPIVFDGSLYYPTGAQIFFNRFDMIRSGYCDWVPLYIRTTLEPFSVLFVPVAGGLMQPYERRRSPVPGTVGTPSPPFPVAVPASTVEPTLDDLRSVFYADRRVDGIESPVADVMPQPASSLGIVGNVPSGPRTVATTGSVRPVRPAALRSAAKPQGLNGVFVEYAGRRWFSKGPAVSLDATAMIASGTHGAAPVYMKPGDATTIYIQVAESTAGLMTPYSIRSPAGR